jgi:hypothetical protein
MNVETHCSASQENGKDILSRNMKRGNPKPSFTLSGVNVPAAIGLESPIDEMGLFIASQMNGKDILNSQKRRDTS